MSRNYRKEYDNYHSRPEQKIRRAARNAARRLFADADPDKDVHHKDNNPLNNDKKNLSLVTQYYNRREPRLRKEVFTNEALSGDVKKWFAKKGLKGIKVRTVSGKNPFMQVTKGRNDKIPNDIIKKAIELEYGKVPSGVRDVNKIAYGNFNDRMFSLGLDKMAKLVKEEVDLDEANYEIKNGKLHISKKDYAKKSKDYKGKRKGKPTLTALDPKTGVTTSFEVVFEEVDESPIVVSNEIMAIKKILDKFENILKKSDFNKKQKLAKALGIKVSLRGKHRVSVEQEEEAGTVTGPHIAGTGDDSSTVIVKKKKKVYRREALKKRIVDNVLTLNNMKAYQRFSKTYKLVNSNGKTVGEYTTADGAVAAAKRKNLKDYEVKQIK